MTLNEIQYVARSVKIVILSSSLNFSTFDHQKPTAPINKN